MAKQKIENKLTKYQGNAWPAMLEVAAREIGVSSDSLRRLELGWAPIVDFKNKRSYQGWWAIPERDADAQPIGISLRARDGYKCMFPGSDHGLVYEPNPEHDQGQQPYKHGAHNWTRLYDAGVDCPVCGKPDGCLVSSEDPDDPQAAICIREKAGSEKPMKFGHLHILKDTGRVRGASPLPASEDPVVIVEGMTDAAAAMDLGFVAVGRPSNKAGLQMLKDLVRNRDVVILGENDEAGREGMVATYQTLEGVASSAKQVLPPEHYKDLRQWKNKTSLTHDEFLDHVEQAQFEPEEQKVLPDAKGLTLAHAFLDSHYRLNGRYILRYDRGVWFLWNGMKYEPVDDKTYLRGPIHKWAYDKYAIHTTAKGEETLKPLDCNIGMVNNIMDAMMNPCPLPTHNPPCWLNGVKGPDPNDCIVFTNGILVISRYLDGAPRSEYLLPLTPDFFTTFAVPFAFDETAKCRRFKKMLKSNLDRNWDKTEMLQQWMGLNLTPSTKYHKMMLMRGPTAAGKSIIASLMGKMVGSDQWCAPNFQTLSSDFGLHNLVGKQVAIMSENRIPQRTDAMQALETILKITGEDTFDVQRKYLPALESYQFPTKFTLTCNELPHLPDHSGAMKRRLLILDFPYSFEGQEDFDLPAKLEKELPGIILWALEGLRKLRQQGHFTVPKEMYESLREWQTTTSPMAAFVEECCEEDRDAETNKHEIFDAWNQWSQEHGMKPLSKSRMFERFKGNAPFVRSDTYQKGGHKFSVFRGVKLKPWAEKQYLGKPE